MVQTRAATKRIESGKALPQNTIVVPPPTKKRRVDAGSPKKRHRGKPGELCQLNLDVLFLLAAYVHPLDLLNLARTCKSLRELLMDKASTFVWKTARHQVDGLPDCPADLTEPEYANLVFYARCHGCGKYAKKVLWLIRRRYCPDCRQTRLCPLLSCPDVIRYGYVLLSEFLKIEVDKGRWVDKEQLDLFTHEYGRSSDKDLFMNEKRHQYRSICEHARKCELWEDDVASEHKFGLELRRQERSQSIFARLKEQGYRPEITYFGYYAIQQSRKSFFKTSKPLTDKEWTRMWPEWLETMTSFRSQRIERSIYKPRRDLLVSEYDSYKTSSSLNTPAFDLLPHVIELSSFPPFRDVIRAPEGTEFGAKLFESAFEQLPVFIEEWRKQLDTELAELVKIPSCLSLKNGSSGRSGTSGSAMRMKSSQTPIDKLRLACAVFETRNAVAHYPDVFSTVLRYPDRIDGRDDWERAMPTQDRFDIKFLEGAPYIVHACGLDPNVATVEDMDRRNARLKCLSCDDSAVRNWRGAMLHALYCSRFESISHPDSTRWHIVSDEHIDAIQTAELSAKNESPLAFTRCLLCRRCIGDSRSENEMMLHLFGCHGMDTVAIQRDVHYTSTCIYASHHSVKMIEEGGKVTFRPWG